MRTTVRTSDTGTGVHTCIWAGCALNNLQYSEISLENSVAEFSSEISQTWEITTSKRTQPNSSEISLRRTEASASPSRSCRRPVSPRFGTRVSQNRGQPVTPAGQPVPVHSTDNSMLTYTYSGNLAVRHDSCHAAERPCCRTPSECWLAHVL